MRVWSATSLPSTAVLWQAASGGWSLTTVAKATFDLAPGESPLAEAHEPIHEHDVYETGGVLRAPSDLAPYKVRPDVVVVGCAFAPRPVGSLVARLIVGTVDKAIEVHRARWVDDAGQLAEGPPFSTMPLGWQAAAGGRESVNPAGMSLDDVDRQGRTALPHQVVPGSRPPGRGDYAEPVAFAPIPPGWPHRAHLAGVAGPAAVGGAWFEAPLPVDVHPAFFNVAPPDQQPDYLADDPRLVLEHLSPSAPRLATTPAAVRAFAFVEGGRAAGRYAMRPDTLWIDTDRQILCITYRATVPLGELEPGVLVTVMSDPPAPLAEPTRVKVHGSEAAIARAEGRPRDDDPSLRQSTSTHLVATDGLPFAAAAPAGNGRAERETPTPSPRPAGLPFQRKPALTRPVETLAATATPFEGRAPSGAGPAALSASPGSMAPPLQPPPPKRRDPAPGTVPPPPPAPPLAPPPGPAAVPAAPLAQPPLSPPMGAAPAMGSSPLSPPISPPAGHPAPSSPRPLPRMPDPPPPVPSPSPSQQGAPAPAAWAFQQAVEPPKKVVHEARAALDGVAGASNAAADRPHGAGGPRAVGAAQERPRVTSNDVVDLVWFDEEIPPRVRRQPTWIDAVRDERRIDDWVTAPETQEQNQQEKDRRAVMRALARVPPTDPSTLPRLLAESVDEEGFVDRPLLVVAGDLALQLDPIETLKASVELASQLGTSEKLKEAIDAAKDIAQAQRVSTPVVDGLLARLRKEFAQANRNLANDYLESTVQRQMLDERTYQKRQVLGGGHLVAHLLGTGGGPTTTVYLPDHLAPQLPVVSKLKVRLIAEPHPQQHPADGEGVALRTLALGRVIGSRGRGAF